MNASGGTALFTASSNQGKLASASSTTGTKLRPAGASKTDIQAGAATSASTGIAAPNSKNVGGGVVTGGGAAAEFDKPQTEEKEKKKVIKKKAGAGVLPRKGKGGGHPAEAKLAANNPLEPSFMMILCGTAPSSKAARSTSSTPSAATTASKDKKEKKEKKDGKKGGCLIA